MRTIVELPDQDITDLDRLGNDQGRSRAAIVREAVSQYVASHTPSSIREGLGIWSHHDEDGLSYQQRLRNEWEENPK